MKEHLLLNDVARLLGVKGYQISYALTNGLVQEPALRISNKRVFSEKDIQRLAVHFGVAINRERKEK
jgi:DNA-binding transcriptional MerR regulator